jgi:hypothetical protein
MEGESMRFMSLLAMALVLSSCQNFSENGLLTNLSSYVKCPANGCADATPNENEMAVAYVGARPLMSPGSDVSIQIGGDCYASTFPTNQITVAVLNQNNTARMATVMAVNGSVLRCVNGRYNVAIDTSNLPAPGIYKVRLQLVAYDAGNMSYTSPGAVMEVPITRY